MSMLVQDYRFVLLFTKTTSKCKVIAWPNSACAVFLRFSYRFEMKLQHPVADGGGNFSVGERQLICMARALLLDPKVLLLDEATASLDQVTDKLVQKMIRQLFADKTVLTIAHRLETIMDSDRVLVLDQGVIAEFDSPPTLLDSNGQFHNMVMADGPTTYKRLEAIARGLAKVGDEVIVVEDVDAENNNNNEEKEKDENEDNVQ